MSLYQFIACDVELPELYSELKRLPNGELKRYFETEHEFTDLEIVKCRNYELYGDVPYYTRKNNIYTLDWEYTDDNVIKLWNYLYHNYTIGQQIEIWSIWLCDYYHLKEDITHKLETIKKTNYSIENLSIDILKGLLSEYGYITPSVIMIG